MRATEMQNKPVSTLNANILKDLMEKHRSIINGNSEIQPTDKVKNFYPIIFSSRCGSTYLTEVMNRCHPDNVVSFEIFDPEIKALAQEKYDLKTKDLLMILMNLGASGLKIFPKISYHHYLKAIKEEPCIDEILWKSRTLFRIRRIDIIGQIMSRYFARTANIWHTYNEEEVNKGYTSGSKELENNTHFELGDAIGFILGGEIGWDDMLKNKEHPIGQIQSLIEFTYEELTDNAINVINMLEEQASLELSYELPVENIPIKNPKNAHYNMIRGLLDRYTDYLNSK